MSDINLQEIHDFLISVAYKAGAAISAAEPSAASAGTKKNSADLVTETDREVEGMVSGLLRERYPGFGFVGEETWSEEEEGDGLGEGAVFVVDPIDGTNNFFHGHPYVCISLGLAIDKRPVIGVIYNPYTQTLYAGIKGQGSYITSPFHNHVRLPLRKPEPLKDLTTCLIAIEWGSDRAGNDYDVKCATFRALAASKESGGAMVHGMRSLGSAELNLCGVAAGHLDLYWENGCWAWDVCAGWVILEEAGGRMVGSQPGDWEPELDQRRYLAVRGGEGKEGVIEEFWGYVKGRVEVGYDKVS